MQFEVWAPQAGRVTLHCEGATRALERDPDRAGWWWTQAEAGDGTRYGYALDDGPVLPDPRSRRQPDGPDGLSAVVEHERYAWRTHWAGRPLPGAVLYELHVGTYTPEGTLDAAAARLEHLVELGVTHVELMPLCPFPGRHGWGYEGVSLWAVHEPYGGPEALKRFVDRAHELGLGVVLDVVHNHLGPSGNYLPAFGPYFTDTHHTPWGSAVNLDAPGSDEVRAYLLGSALSWLRDYRIDGLRLDAVRADGDGETRDVLGGVADDRVGPVEDAPHPAVGADHEVFAGQGVVHEDRAAGLRGELDRGGRGELLEPGRVELVGRAQEFGGPAGLPAQRLQGARGEAWDAERLGLPYGHLAQSGEEPGQVGLADGGDVVLLRRAAGHLGVQRVRQPWRPLALRDAGRHRDRDVRADQVAQAQFTASAGRGRAVGGEAQHMAGADPPGGVLAALGDGPDLGPAGDRRAVLEQGTDQPADRVRGGCRCLGHGRAVVSRGWKGSWGFGQSTMTISRVVSLSLRPPSSVTVTMSSMRTPKRPGR